MVLAGPFFILIFFSETLHSELVQSIQIIGNQYTKDHIILREIQHSVPGDFNQSVAQEDRDRIYNLGLFSTVDIFEKDSLYTITVVETFRFQIAISAKHWGQVVGSGQGFYFSKYVCCTRCSTHLLLCIFEYNCK